MCFKLDANHTMTRIAILYPYAIRKNEKFSGNPEVYDFIGDNAPLGFSYFMTD
jgi:hypothetical protein